MTSDILSNDRQKVAGVALAALTQRGRVLHGVMSSSAAADPRKAVLVDARTISWHGETWSLEKKLGSGRFASVYEMHCSTNPAKQKVAALRGSRPEELALPA